MSDQTDLKVHLTAEDDASPVIRALLRNVRRLEKLSEKLSPKASLYAGLNAQAAKALDTHRKIASTQRSVAVASARAEKANDASFRQRITFGQRMNAQRAKDERQRDLLSMRALRQRIMFSDRMNRQRHREERAVAAENRRQDAAARREERQHRQHLSRLDRQTRQRRRETTRSAGRVRSGLSDSAGAGGAAGLALGAGAAVAGRRILGIEIDNDRAMRDLQAYGGIDRSAVLKLKNEWAEKFAVEVGGTVSGLLDSYTNALKAGIPEKDARQFTSLATKASEAWSMSVESVTDTLGTVAAIMTSGGSAYNPKHMASIVNTLQALAAKTNATPEGLVEYQKQAAGGAQLLGMSQENALAIGAASMSLGNRPGESGRMLDFTASKLIALPGLSKRKGTEGDAARKLIRSLGYGSGDQLDRARRADPDRFMVDLFGKLSKLKGRQRDESLRTLFGTEWLGEGSRLVTGNAKLREAVKIAKDPASQRAIDDLWSIHTKKLQFSLQRLRSSLGVVLGGFGEIMAPFIRDFSSTLADWLGKSATALRMNFWAAIQGLSEGLLGPGRKLRDLFSGGLIANPQAFYDFAKGFAEGLRTIWNTVVGIMSGLGKVFGIDAGNSEGLGRVIGMAIGGSIAAKLVPTDLIGGAANGMGELLQLFGVGSGAAAGAAIGSAAAKAIPQIAIVGTVAVEVINWASDRDRYDAKSLERFGAAGGGAEGANAAGVFGSAFLALRVWRDMVRRKIVGDKATEEGGLVKPMRDLRTSIDATAKIQKAALDRAGLFRDLIVPASFGGSSARLGGSIGSGYAGPSTASLTGAATLNGATPGAILPDFGVGRSGAAMSGGNRAVLDAIARAEGTAGRGDYEVVLGYGKYGKPSKPLTSMTLAEAYAFGDQVKAKHGSSSAKGRYQIVNSTMMAAAKAMGMDLNSTRFDAATQDRMAGWIAQNQGFGAWTGFRRHPGELATAKAAIANVPASGSAAGAVDRGMGLLGASERGPGRSAINAMLKQGGFNVDSARTAWCAAFVGSNLKAMGIRGSGSLTASSYLNWGEKIDPAGVLKGDVLVEGRGRRAGETGAHVGMATGNKRTGKDGGLEIEMLSGNSGRNGSVATTWEKASSLAIRRAISAVPSVQAITSNVPVPDTPTRAGGAFSGQQPAAAPNIVINPHPGQSPQEIAAAVERRLAERRISYQHDVEFS